MKIWDLYKGKGNNIIRCIIRDTDKPIIVTNVTFLSFIVLFAFLPVILTNNIYANDIDTTSKNVSSIRYLRIEQMFRAI